MVDRSWFSWLIFESLKLLQKIFREKPYQFMPLLKIVLDAKSDEFVNIFTESFPDEKNRIVTLLKEIDPSNSDKYEKIRKSG